MALIPHEFVFRGNLSAIGPFHSQCFVDSLVDGNITAVYFRAESVANFSGDWYFGLQDEGGDVLTGTNRPKITAGNLRPYKDGLSIPVSFRHRLIPTVNARGLGTINGPVVVTVIIDDGVTDSVGAAMHAATTQNPPVDTDEFGFWSTVSSLLKKCSWANLKTALTTHFDTRYATPADVSGAIAGLSWKQRVRAATAAAGTLASGFENGDTIDGVLLVTGDRILIKDQAAPEENGIYTVNASGAPTRSTDADAGTELVSASVYVSEGTDNGAKQFTQVTPGPITLGTTGIEFTIFNSGGAGAFGDLTDVTAPTPALGDVPVFNGIDWVNSKTLGDAGAGLDLDIAVSVASLGDVAGGGNNSLLQVDDANEKIIANKHIDIVNGNIRVTPNAITGLGIINDNYSTADVLTGLFLMDSFIQFGMVYMAAGNSVYSVWQEFIKTRSADGNTYTAVQLDDELARFNFSGDDGVGLLMRSGAFMCLVDGAVSSGVVPGRLEFHTAASGQAILRMVIKANGKVGIGTPAPAAQLDVKSTTEQFRVRYDDTHYYKITVDASGNASIDLVGTSPEFTFGKKLNIPAPTASGHAATKGYVDAAVVAGGGYTDEAAQDAIGGILDTTPSGDIIFDYDDLVPLISALIKPDVALSGNPTTTTQTPADNSTKIATTAYVDAATAGGGYTDEQAQDAVGAMADGTLTYNDAAPSLGIANDVALPGNPTTTTQTAGNNTTRIATTAFVQAAVTGGSGGTDLGKLYASLDGELTF